MRVSISLRASPARLTTPETINRRPRTIFFITTLRIGRGSQVQTVRGGWIFNDADTVIVLVLVLEPLSRSDDGSRILRNSSIVATRRIVHSNPQPWAEATRLPSIVASRQRFEDEDEIGATGMSKLIAGTVEKRSSRPRRAQFKNLRKRSRAFSSRLLLRTSGGLDASDFQGLRLGIFRFSRAFDVDDDRLRFARRFGLAIPNCFLQLLKQAFGLF